MSRILGIGLDIVELSRLEQAHRRHGDRFVAKFCRPGEAKGREGNALLEHLGGLFAAKEAVMKALGTGWAEGVGFLQIEVISPHRQQPRVQLHGRAAELADEMGIETVHVSITHDRSMAAAVAVLEGDS